MSELTLKLSDDQLKGALSEAILSTLDQATREAIIRGAVNYIITKPQSGGYGSDQRSPIERAFHEAAYTVAREIATKELANDSDFLDKLRGLLREASERAFVEQREEILTNITKTMVDAMRVKERY